MTPTRKLSITAGTLFVLATAATLTSSALLPDLTQDAYLAGVADHPDRLLTAAGLALFSACCSVGIAIALYPIVRASSAALAIGAVVFRTVEAVFYTVEVVCLLTISTIAHDLTTSPGADRATSTSVADSLVSLREHAALVAVVAFAIGATLYYLVFYRSRTTPRWLSAWGLIGTGTMLIACGLALFNDRMVSSYILLAAVIGVQELAFAGWLLVKGFAAESGSSHSPNNQEGSGATPVGTRAPASTS